MATVKKACKGVSYPKPSNVSRKLKSGGSLGMKSVKAGYDKNPGVTRADIIVAGKGQAKKGMKIKKAQPGVTEAKATTTTNTTIHSPLLKPSTTTKKTRVVSPDKKEVTITKEKSGPSGVKSKTITRPTVYGGVSKALDKAGTYLSKKLDFKKGGKMTKKCKYGCK